MGHVSSTCPVFISLKRKDESRQDETRFAQTNILLIVFNPFAFSCGKWVKSTSASYSSELNQVISKEGVLKSPVNYGGCVDVRRDSRQ